MEKRKYKRRKLSDYEIEAMLAKWLELGRAPSGVRAHVWKWLKHDAEGLAKSIADYDRLLARERSLLIEKMLWEHRLFAIRDILTAAELTLRDYSRAFSVRFFTRPQLLACFALRLYLNKGQRGLALHLERQVPERLLIFGRALNLPKSPTYKTFEQRLSDDDFQTFQTHLKKTNPVAAEIIKSRYEMKAT